MADAEFFYVRFHGTAEIGDGTARALQLVAELFELGASGKATARMGVSDDPAVLEAASACPMGAIRVVEEEAA